MNEEPRPLTNFQAALLCLTAAFLVAIVVVVAIALTSGSPSKPHPTCKGVGIQRIIRYADGGVNTIVCTNGYTYQPSYQGGY